MEREEFIVLIGYGCVSLVVTSLIESVVYGRALRLSLGKAIQLSGLVNLASTVGCVRNGQGLGPKEGMDTRPNGSSPRGQGSIPVPPPVPIPKRPPRAWLWAGGAFLLAAVLIVGVLGLKFLMPKKHSVVEVNAVYPSNQQQAKFMALSAWKLQHVPNAANWCDALNATPKDWPGVPASTVFALNAQAAGRALTSLPRDLLVFFETPKPGWNQSGGPELLARKDSGVAVALADGRALLVPPDQTAKLRWNP